MDHVSEHERDQNTGHWLPGIPSPNPGGRLTKAQRTAQRDANMRELAEPLGSTGSMRWNRSESNGPRSCSCSGQRATTIVFAQSIPATGCFAALRPAFAGVVV